MASITIDWRDTPPDQCRGGALTIGNFDGVHRGHAALLDVLRGQARAQSGPAVVLTFDPHPLELLRPGQVLETLTTPADRVRLLQEYGADFVVVVRVTKDLLQLSAEEFFERVVRTQFAVQAMVEGDNFGFGRDRQGTVQTLSRLCDQDGIRLTVVPPVRLAGIEVSSSRIRASLLSGDVAGAAEQLGRSYRLQGTVGEGQRRGAKLGFPTANLMALRTLAPGDGVYATRVRVGDSVWPSATNIGPNPTFGENARKVEVHLIGYQGNLYGQTLAVEFVRHLRDTRPFRNVEELVEQLNLDTRQALHLFRETEK